MSELVLECAVQPSDSIEIAECTWGIEIIVYNGSDHASLQLNHDSIKALQEFLNKLVKD